MGLCKLLLYAFVILGGYLTYRYYPCLMKCSHQQQIDFTEFKIDGWFGQGKSIADSNQIKPFRLNISHDVLNDLRDRLRRSRFIDHIDGTKFNYGFNSDYLKQIQQYWLTKYDWRLFETEISKFPQFKTKIEGLDIHFIHVKPNNPKAKTIIPIIMFHGWPGSFWEFTKIIPLLSKSDPNNNNNDDVAFEIVVPSIPGYGYSEAPHQAGFHLPASARIFTKLMKRLGHEKFFAHGGDWGAGITRNLGTIYPENLRGIHMVGTFWSPSKPCDYLKMFLGYMFPKQYFGDNWEFEWNKMFPFGEKFKFLLRETGYMHIQATRPDTVGSALMDSPIGLAAYIMEKFSVWTNPNKLDLDDGGLTEKFQLDQLLNNVMIYWTSGNIASSQRFYLENLGNYHIIDKIGKANVKAPTGIIEARHDLGRAPRKFVESSFENLLQFTDLEIGGHFLGYEEPKIVADDIRAFVGKVLELEQQQQEKQEKEQEEKRKQQQEEGKQKKHDEI